MTVGNTSFNQIWPQIAKYQQQINTVIVVLLVLYLLAFAAELTWRLMPQPDSATEQSASSLNNAAIKRGSSQRIDLSQLKRLNLFGDLTAEPVVEEVVTDAPETRLNLTLTGVVATSDPAIAVAIIENKGTQATYGIDDKIEQTNAILKEVYVDRVIIKNGARHETLMLDGIDYEKNAPITPQKNQSALAQRLTGGSPDTLRSTLSPDLAEATRELQESPAQFTDYIAIAPTREDGELKGYTISPGKKPQLFKAAGFKAGDIITEINGLDLTDPQQALEAMTALREAQSLQLTVNRDGDIVTLYLDFPSAGLEI